METLLTNSENYDILFVFALFFASISGISLTTNMRVTLVYAVTFLFYFLDAINAATSFLGAVFVLFLVLEIFNNDYSRRRLFGIFRKLLDCAFQLFVEYYFFLFAASELGVWFLRRLQAPEYLTTMTGFLLILTTIALTSRAKFATNTITEIIERLSKNIYIEDASLDDELSQKLGILLAMEDKDFLERKENQHTIPLRDLVKAVRKRKLRRVMRHPVDNVKKILVRGYGTIEMQLIRTLGIRLGSYDYKIRRKIYELLYANMIFNSYMGLFPKQSVARRNIRPWILRNYVCCVSVKFGEHIYYSTREKDTIQQLFGRSLEEVSKEEFFIWCLGLRYYDHGVGPIAISVYENLVSQYELDTLELEVIAQKCMKGES